MPFALFVIKRHCWLVFSWGSVATLRSFSAGLPLAQSAASLISLYLHSFRWLIPQVSLWHSFHYHTVSLDVQFCLGFFCLGFCGDFFLCQNRIRTVCPPLLTICDNLKLMQESRTWQSERKMVLNIRPSPQRASLDLCPGEESWISEHVNLQGKEYVSFNFHLCNDKLFLLNSCIVSKILVFLSHCPSSGYTITLTQRYSLLAFEDVIPVETVHPYATWWIFFIDKYILSFWGCEYQQLSDEEKLTGISKTTLQSHCEYLQ